MYDTSTTHRPGAHRDHHHCCRNLAVALTGTAARRTGSAVVELDGDLTIKGTTRPVTIPFTYEGSALDPYGSTRLGFEGSVIISRSGYGVSFNAALETGGVLISEKITLELEVSAVRNA